MVSFYSFESHCFFWPPYGVNSVIPGECGGDTLPLLDGYSGYGIQHFASYWGAGIDALFWHGDGYGGAGLFKSILVWILFC